MNNRKSKNFDENWQTFESNLIHSIQIKSFDGTIKKKRKKEKKKIGKHSNRINLKLHLILEPNRQSGAKEIASG